MRASLQSKTILVTGGTGFIGSKVVKKLKENKNIYIIILSRSKSGKEHSNIEYVKCDLSNEIDFKKIYTRIMDADYILHMAAMVPRSSLQQENIEENIKQNLLTTINLLKYLPKNLEGFIYSSTIDVYGRPLYVPINESHPTNPLTYYGASKLASEKYLNIFLSHRGVPLTILRYSQVYGPGEPKIKAIPVFIDKILKNESPILFGNGSDIRDYVYVDDIANATISALKKNIGGVFNIGSGVGYHIREVLDTIIKISGKNIKPIYKKRIKEAYASIMNITKAKEELGYVPSTTLEQGLRKEYEWMKKHYKGI